MTTTRTKTIQNTLDDANLSEFDAALKKMRLGTMLSPVKVTIAGLTAAAAVNITSAAALAAATYSGIELFSGERLPPIQSVIALRVTAVGTGALGPRVVTDVGGTPAAPGGGAVGVATISDDGTTLTFEGTVTGFVLEYLPRSYTAMTSELAPSS